MNTVKPSFRLWSDLVREQALPLFVLFAIGSLLSLSFENAMQNLSRAEEDSRWMYQLGLGLVDLVEGVVQILILSWGVPKVRQLTEAHFVRHPFESSYLNSFLAEYLRTLASVLLWALLLVIPGFVRYSRLIFVPFITLFAKPYRDGEADAFELSLALTRGRLKTLMGLVLASMLLQVGLELLPQSEALHSVPFRLVCGAAGFLLAGWVYAFTYLQFEDAMEKYQWS